MFVYLSNVILPLLNNETGRNSIRLYVCRNTLHIAILKDLGLTIVNIREGLETH